MNIRSIYLSLALASCVLTASCDNPFKAKDDPGRYYKITTNLIYHGEPVTISYQFGCDVLSSRNPDGDRSVDGAALIPFVWGQEMPDGGALMMETPSACWSKVGTGEPFKLPETHNPFIVHFADAREPWEGVGYVESVAYDSPLSVMKYRGTEVERITRDDWLQWYQSAGRDNWVTYEKLGLAEGTFSNYKLQLGQKTIPGLCTFGIAVDLTPELKAYIKNLNRSLPQIWGPGSTIFADAKLFPEFEGKGLNYYHVNGAWDKLPTYPTVSHKGFNRRDSFGGVQRSDIIPAGSIRSPKLDKNRKGILAGDLLFDKDHRGFSYCRDSDPNQDTRLFPEDWFAEIVSVNGEQVITDENSGPLPAYAIIGASIFIQFKRMNIHRLGGKL